MKFKEVIAKRSLPLDSPAALILFSFFPPQRKFTFAPSVGAVCLSRFLLKTLRYIVAPPPPFPLPLIFATHRARSTSSATNRETILHLRRDYTSLLDNRKYAEE